MSSFTCQGNCPWRQVYVNSCYLFKCCQRLGNKKKNIWEVQLKRNCWNYHHWTCWVLGSVLRDTGDSCDVLCRGWIWWYPSQPRIFYNSDSNLVNAFKAVSLQDRKESGEMDMQHLRSSTDFWGVWIQQLLGQKWWKGAPKGTEHPEGCLGESGHPGHSRKLFLPTNEVF